jgi:hypothetical protein
MMMMSMPAAISCEAPADALVFGNYDGALFKPDQLSGQFAAFEHWLKSTFLLSIGNSDGAVPHWPQRVGLLGWRRKRKAQAAA